MSRHIAEYDATQHPHPYPTPTTYLGPIRHLVVTNILKRYEKITITPPPLNNLQAPPPIHFYPATKLRAPQRSTPYQFRYYANPTGYAIFRYNLRI